MQGRARHERTGPGAIALSAMLALATILGPNPARAVQLDALDPVREWRLAALEFRGNESLPTDELRRAMVTKPRPWYMAWRFWQPLPDFDPITFRADLDRLRQLYRNRGYYAARIDHDVELPAEGNAVRAVVYVTQGTPVYVESVSVDLAGIPLPPAERELLLSHLPLERGDVFDQGKYERGYAYLRSYYREHGFARVHVTRATRVEVKRNAAAVTYRVESGPSSVFGEVSIGGTHHVDPDVVRREVVFRPGEPFKESLVERTRANLVALRLFRAVRVDEDKSRDPRVDTRISVTEGPKHEVALGLGYDTEEQLRGLATWRDYDFFGGGRQLGFTARASFLRRTIAADFLQPHFPGPRDRVRLQLSEQQEDEETYTNDRARLTPRIEWAALPNVTSYAFYRLEYDSLSSVSKRVERLFPAIATHHGLLSGLGFGADWNATDDLIDPSRGWVTSASVEPVGGFLGGKFSFIRLSAEGRWYQPLPERLLGALRLRLGAAKPIGNSDDIPLFERFYAGGLNSVRGYERRHVASSDVPGSSDGLVGGDPIGGRTLVDGSLELRHPITEKIGAAVFFDAGQVSLRTFDFPFDDLRYGTGFGVSYKSPIGPLRVDLGFPVPGPPHGDASWQVHVSVGQVF
jgi:outer membrane protein insertion porin family